MGRPKKLPPVEELETSVVKDKALSILNAELDRISLIPASQRKAADTRIVISIFTALNNAEKQEEKELNNIRTQINVMSPDEMMQAASQYVPMAARKCVGLLEQTINQEQQCQQKDND